MSKKITLLYDTTREECDKKWVMEGLQEKGYTVKPLYCPCAVFTLEQKGKVGKLIAIIMITLQCIGAAMQTKPYESVFCWNHWTGLIMNLLFGKKRYIISYNWLTPKMNPKTQWIYRKALENPRLCAVVNSQENRKKLLEAYQANDQNNIYYIPDVYDDTISFQSFEAGCQESYCFMGGVENRDWDMFLEIARQCPEIAFVGVTAKTQAINESEIPNNVEMHYDVSMEEYYGLMANSCFCICLLKEDRVSGLINILKAAQLGKIMLITKTAATTLYFPKEQEKCLLERDQISSAVQRIKELKDCSVAEYEALLGQWQTYIRKEYSPECAVNTICKMLER